ncbi:MAG: ATPase domain-containing protein [Euryarchaeota archaeon]|nr:ATPase domain-containing protein [Euryarchaeota archaeon]
MERIKTGVQGLDEKMQGGIPKNSTIAVIGTFGTGKSTLGMQFLYEGLKNGENSIFISLDDDEENLIATAEEFGWGFKKYVDEDKLLLMKLSALDIKTSLLRIRSELPRLFKSFGTKRCVFDSITLFEMLFENENERRLIVHDLTRIIKASGATSIITSETDKSNPHASRFGMIEYVTDGVLFLNYHRHASEITVRLSIEITKLRRTNHSRDIMTYDISKHGLEVIS